jgi:hypothetical protein
MRVRGGFELDLNWDDGRLQGLRISNLSNPDGKCRLKVGSKELDVQVPKGEQIDVPLPE